MNPAKKLLAILLVFALALGFTVPAGAIDWDEFTILTQPQSQSIPYGSDFTLYVEVNIPDGVEAAYQWYYDASSPIEGAVQAEFHCTPDHPDYVPYDQFHDDSHRNYWCKVTGKGYDGEELTEAEPLRSAAAEIRVGKTAWGKAKSTCIRVLLWIAYAVAMIFIGPPFYAYYMTGMLSLLSVGLLLPFAPVIFLVNYVVALVTLPFGFFQLFKK